MKRQIPIAALTVAALTSCGSGSEGGAAIEPSTPTEVSTSLQPEPNPEPATSDADTSSTTSDDTTASTAPTTSIVASTSPPPTTNEVVPPTDVAATPVSTDSQQGPVVGLRLDDDAALFGVAVLQEVDVEATIDAVSDALGAPTSMTEWAPMPEPLAAAGVQEFREIWWSDLRVVFERTDDVARLSSWNLGASRTTGCFPPATTEPTGESMVVTADGIGIGSDSDVVADHHFLVNESSEGATIVNVNPISLSFTDGEVTGLAQSRADCFTVGSALVVAQIGSCPALAFTTLVDGWNPVVENLQGGGIHPGNHIGGPDSYMNLFAGGSAFGPRNGQAVEVDGYQAIRGAIEDGLGVHIDIGEPDCEFFDLTFYGNSESDVSMILDGLKIGL